MPDATASAVYQAHQLVNDHLKAFNAGLMYECSDNAPKVAIVNNEEEDVAAAVTQYTSLLPRIRMSMAKQPPFFIENRARELIMGWHTQGMRALAPRTIAASAMYMAADDLPKDMIEGGALELDAEMLCAAAEIDTNTLQNGIRELRKMGPVHNSYLD